MNQCDQMRQFCAVWAIYRGPWVLFFLCFLLLGHFYVQFLFSGGDFWAKCCFFAKLWVLFHLKQLVALFFLGGQMYLGYFISC